LAAPVSRVAARSIEALMSTSDETGGFLAFDMHPDRQAVLGEVHARPFPLLTAPLRAINLAFQTTNTPDEDVTLVRGWFEKHGSTPPAPGSRYHRAHAEFGVLRWERHSEFVTYNWRCARDVDPLRDEVPIGPFGEGFRQPGPLIGGGVFFLVKEPIDIDALFSSFDRRSLNVSEVENGRAIVATDFRQNAQGLTRYVVIDKGLSEARAGAVFLRLQEVETYRMTTLLGLPVARAAAPTVDRIEGELAAITGEIRSSAELSSNRALLSRLTDLAGELEAEMSRTAYRMSATRAYDDVLWLRLKGLGEVAYPGFETLSTFLARRITPAVRTCQTIERRQTDLALKLARAIDLLRARVAIDVEHQNVELLNSMNRRAKLQLRLQQTVEGLSIGAISYYLLGIVGYAAKALKSAELLPIAPEIVVGLFVPIVIGLVFWVTRRIRKHHAESGD